MKWGTPPRTEVIGVAGKKMKTRTGNQARLSGQQEGYNIATLWKKKKNFHPVQRKKKNAGGSLNNKTLTDEQTKHRNGNQRGKEYLCTKCA